ncbi:MAG: hypothetical protein JWO05_2777 [Gemmatimonadetes bacterium]|nr:hypothetical protein [Gemmatimonadota bacterium]
MRRPAVRSTTAFAVLLSLAAMVRYPGGDPLDHSAVRYSPSRNFLSDLGMTVAYDGQPNRLGAALFAASIIALVAAGFLALLTLRAELSTTPSGRAYLRASGIVTLLTSVAFVAVGFTPENAVMSLHVQATMLGFRLLPVAVALLAAAAWQGGPALRPRALLLSAVATAFACYAAFLALGPSPDTPHGLQQDVIAQKVVAVLMVAFLWMLGAPRRTS